MGERPLLRRSGYPAPSPVRWWLAVVDVVDLTVGPLRPLLSPAACVVWVALIGRESLLPAIAEWVSRMAPAEALAIVVSWPMLGFVLLAVIGPGWLRGYLESIERAGGIERRSRTRGVRDGRPDEAEDG